MKNILFALATIIALMSTSCKKEEGEGGNSSIYGRVWVRDYNINFSWLNGEYPAYDHEVYIIYGNNIGYGERTRTTPDGYYEFKYLRPGDYTIYTYSRDSTMTTVSGDTAFYKSVNIPSKKARVDAGTIIIYD